MTDESLLDKALRSGNKKQLNKCFEYLYNQYKNLIAFNIAKYIPEKEIIQDLVNETYLSFFNNADKVNRNIKNYLINTSKNLTINYLNKNKNNLVLNEETLYDVEKNISLNNNIKTLLLDMRQVLSQEEIEIIIYHLFENNSFIDIAAIKKVSSNTIKTKYFRALKKYREHIEKGGNNNE